MMGGEIAEADPCRRRNHGLVFAKRTSLHAYGRWGMSPRTSGLTPLRGGRSGRG